MPTFKILASVGKNGKNYAKDVKLVQALLNVYARTQQVSPLHITGQTGADLENAITEFQRKHLKTPNPDGRVDPNGKTFQQLKVCLGTVFKPVAISPPSFGLVTWKSEGTEGGRYHSRKLHVPSSASGLTIGRGYDMKTKSSTAISKDLIAAGIDAKQASILKSATGLSGDAAGHFMIDKDLLDFQITASAQKKLFEVSYDTESDEVKRICAKKDVVLTYGKTDWSKLNSAIKDITIDLKFRGDYTSDARKHIQKSIADNNLVTFITKLKDKTLWPNVPTDRFERRIKFLDSIKQP